MGCQHLHQIGSESLMARVVTQPDRGHRIEIGGQAGTGHDQAIGGGPLRQAQAPQR